MKVTPFWIIAQAQEQPPWLVITQIEILYVWKKINIILKKA